MLAIHTALDIDNLTLFKVGKSPLVNNKFGITMSAMVNKKSVGGIDPGKLFNLSSAICLISLASDNLVHFQIFVQ